MEQRAVLKENNRCIFYLNDGNVRFYVIIPRASSVSLAISIFDSIDDNSIKDIPGISDKAVIVPLIDANLLNNVSRGDSNYFSNLDSILSVAVNVSYKLLKFNNIFVNNKVIMDYNEVYSNFNNWYALKYKDRVELVNLGIHKPSIKSEPVVNNNVQQQNIDVTLTNFVPEENMDNNLVSDEQIEDNASSVSSPGFVSYVLLGVIVAVVSLVILYMLI